MRKDLHTHICIVTGGAQGIGWAVALALADHGAQVFVCDISDESLRRAAAELATTPWAGRVTLARCDVSDRQAFEGWIHEVHRQTGRIDVLVNNAAFVRWDRVDAMTVEDEERTMRVGFNGMIYGIKAVLPLMQAAGGGHIVNMGSVTGKVFVSGPSAAYAAVKAAYEGYTRILQVELAGSPVSATLVRLGTVAGTEFFKKHVPRERMPRLADFIPYLTPPVVARRIVRAIQERREILDVPGFLKAFYWAFELAPSLVRWLMTLGGRGRRDYSRIEWRYEGSEQQ